MISNRLHDDLIQDFKEQKAVISQQIAIFDPLAASLRKPAAYRLMSAGGLILAEILCYLLFLTSVAFVFLLPRVYPFSVIFRKLEYQWHFSDLSRLSDVQLACIGIYFLGGLTALLFLILGRVTRRVRLKNTILNLAGKDIKTLVGQHLQRKAAIESIEQRHFNEMPSLLSGDPDANLVPNPGYGEDDK